MSKQTRFDKLNELLNLKVKEGHDSKLENLLKTPKKDSHINTPVTQVPTKNAVHQADLLFLPTDEDGSKYALVVVDLADSKLDAEPLKTKSAKDVLVAIKKIYSRKVLNTPKHIEVDSGTEFQSTFKKDFENKKVDVIKKKAGRSRSQSVVEAANSLLSNFLNKLMLNEEIHTGEVSRDWVENLPTVVDALNKTNLRQAKRISIKEPIKAKGDAKKLIPEGTKVRVIIDKPQEFLTGKRLNGKFRKGDIRFENDTTTVENIILKPGQVPLYRTKKYPKGPSYTKNQLQVVVGKEAIPEQQKKFIVEKIIGKKKEKGKIFYKIKWKDFDESFDLWVPRTQLIKDVPGIIKEHEKNLKKS